MKLFDNYHFDRFGQSYVEETDDDFDQVITDRNRELEELDGGDKYDFAEKNEDKLIYEVPKGTINEYGKIPEIDKGNGEGTIFTVTDQDHADNIFRMLGGNSLVEYGLIDYADSNENKESQIWTNTRKTALSVKPAYNASREKKTITRKVHSHPFKGGHNDYVSGAYPSPADVKLLYNYDNYNGLKNTKHKIYSAYNPFKETIPTYASFDKNGPKEITSRDRDLYTGKIVADILDADYDKNIKKEDVEKFRNYYLWK